MAWTIPKYWAANPTNFVASTTATLTWNSIPPVPQSKPPFRISKMWGGSKMKNRCDFYDIEGSMGYYVACRRKVWKKVPDVGPMCKRHTWQWFQLQEEKMEQAMASAIASLAGWKWYQKNKEEVKKLKEDDHWWFKKELLRELKGDN